MVLTTINVITDSGLKVQSVNVVNSCTVCKATPTIYMYFVLLFIYFHFFGNFWQLEVDLRLQKSEIPFLKWRFMEPFNARAAPEAWQNTILHYFFVKTRIMLKKWSLSFFKFWCSWNVRPIKSLYCFVQLNNPPPKKDQINNAFSSSSWHSDFPTLYDDDIQTYLFSLKRITVCGCRCYLSSEDFDKTWNISLIHSVINM